MEYRIEHREQPASRVHEHAQAAMAVVLREREKAATVVGAYIGLSSLSTRCAWVMQDGGHYAGERCELHVDGRAVWRCWWIDFAVENRMELVCEWLVQPWTLDR